ncbi:hypothetical protein FS837_012356 [Tulasnella sp. UAMH 9824]|nr:hypothetical protein FS837_012356 [Tulasnella sp. UAMH 9824]
MLSLQVLFLALLLTCVDAVPLNVALSESTVKARRSVSTTSPRIKAKANLTRKQGIILGSVVGGWIVFVLLLTLRQKIRNQRRAQREKEENREEFQKTVEFDRNGKPFFKPKAPPKKTPSMPDLGSGTTAPSLGEKPMQGAVDDSGVPSLAHATTVKKPAPVVTRREKDAWKEGTTVVAGPDTQDQEVTGVADLSLEKVKGGQRVEKAPFRLF